MLAPPNRYLVVGREASTQALLAALKNDGLEADLFSEVNDEQGLLKMSSKYCSIIIRAPMFTNPPLEQVIKLLRMKFRGRIVIDYVPFQSFSAMALRKLGADEVIFGSQPPSDVVALARVDPVLVEPRSLREAARRKRQPSKRNKITPWR